MRSFLAYMFLNYFFFNMSYYNQLVQEIKDELTKLGEERKAWNPGRITNTIYNRHAHEIIEGGEFAEYNTRQNLRNVVGRVITKMAGDIQPPKSEQLSLQGRGFTVEGYEHLQHYYNIERGGEDCAVHVSRLSSTERQEIARRLKKTGETCIRHSAEMLVYDAKASSPQFFTSHKSKDNEAVKNT